ncbi:hypothetical protein M885DRAFT_498431 [Pelagophyceae sp. CCMP2097]|nr:hypothetical protein M885DRAFT_498431 [Pelagophyceae sp. CCMP2097]
MQATASRSRSLARLAPAPERFHAAELCVRNLATETTAEDVRLAFAELGDVMGIRLQTDKKTGRGRAFVALDADEADAIRIILDGSTLGGSVITVDAAAPAKVKGAPSRASGGVSAARLNGVSAARLNDRLVSASSAADVLGVAVGVGDRDCINLATALHRVGALAGTWRPCVGINC